MNGDSPEDSASRPPLIETALPRADPDQTASDADQTASGADQAASERDAEDAAKDQLSADEDEATLEAAHLGSDRTSVSREATRANRLATNTSRAETAGNRAATASDRNATADFRDEAARARDLTAINMERSIANSDASFEQRIGKLREQSAAVRSRAAADRTRAAQDRGDAASELVRLEESSVRYRGLLEAAPDAMVVVDENGRIVLLNLQAEKQFGYHRDELVGQLVTNLIPEGFAERLIADDLRSTADALAQQIGTGIELVGRRKDGSEFPIEIMLSPLENAAGILVTAAIRNITQRKQLEGQLLQAQKLESIGRLTGGIAHDFNNMLFVINGRAEMLGQDLASDRRTELDLDQMRQNVGAILQAGERAAALTRQLLAFSHQQVISPKVLNLNDAIENLEPMVRQLIGEDMGLDLNLDSDPGYIRMDAGQLDQILVNLVVNARDAMPDGGTVTVETRRAMVDRAFTGQHVDLAPGRYVLLVVSDTGIGMDIATKDQIFDPFFTTKGRGGGTGLGLATAYGIVHQASGTIVVHSEPGAGSVFSLYFPRFEAPEPDHKPSRAAASAPTIGTILVVEDDPAVLEMTTQMIARSGFEVIGVADGAEAIARLARPAASIDVVVTDVVMPHMSGIELAGVVLDRFPRVGVVLLSGYTSQTLKLELVTARGAMFVAKPVNSPELVSAIQEALWRALANQDLTEPPVPPLASS